MFVADTDGLVPAAAAAAVVVVVVGTVVSLSAQARSG